MRVQSSIQWKTNRVKPTTSQGHCWYINVATCKWVQIKLQENSCLLLLLGNIRFTEPRWFGLSEGSTYGIMTETATKIALKCFTLGDIWGITIHFCDTGYGNFLTLTWFCLLCFSYMYCISIGSWRCHYYMPEKKFSFFLFPFWHGYILSLPIGFQLSFRWCKYNVANSYISQVVLGHLFIYILVNLLQ